MNDDDDELEMDEQIDEDEDLMEQVARHGWGDRSQWEKFSTGPVDDLAWARVQRTRRAFEERNRRTPAETIAALRTELAKERKEGREVKRKLRIALRKPIADMTDVEIQDELADGFGGNTFEQEVDRMMRDHADYYGGSRENCEARFKRRLAENRAGQEWALRAQRAEDDAGGKAVDIGPPPFSRWSPKSTR